MTAPSELSRVDHAAIRPGRSHKPRRFPVSDGRFIGEIGYVLDGPATGTVSATAGTRYVAWNTNVLRLLGRKKPGIGIALTALLGEDLARKLSESVQQAPATV